MTDGMASLFVDVHLSKAKLNVSLDGNCFLIAFTVNENSLQEMILRVLADCCTSSLRSALYDHSSSRFDIVFQRIWAGINPNMR